MKGGEYMANWSKEVFAKNLKTYMDMKGKTQKELAEIVGVSAPTVNDWIKAKKFPRIDRVEMLADYFGILKSDLIEEKVTEEAQKKNDVAVDIVIRLGADKEFAEAVKLLYKLDSKQIAGIKSLLSSFL